jgi:hypothetical protein
MLSRFLPVNPDEDIHIEKFHGDSIRSRRDTLELRSTPGSVPVPENVTNGFGFCRDGLPGLASRATVNASSITSPKEHLRSTETFFASLSK